ncbi:MAG: hypothetical protein ABIK96_07340 [bacterium]
MARTVAPLSTALRMNRHSVPRTMAVTSNPVSAMSSAVIPLRWSSARMPSRVRWRSASLWVRRGMALRLGTPLISMRVPPVTETLTSWRAAPLPVRTMPLDRHRWRSTWPTAMASSGVFMSGSVTVSIRGMPRRSVR